jgi:predicted amidohydrolase
VNRIGSDGNNLLYAGDSMVIDPKGEILLNMGNACNSMQTISIDLKQLNDYRASFPVWMDGDNFMLI